MIAFHDCTTWLNAFYLPRFLSLDHCNPVDLPALIYYSPMTTSRLSIRFSKPWCSSPRMETLKIFGMRCARLHMETPTSQCGNARRSSRLIRVSSVFASHITTASMRVRFYHLTYGSGHVYVWVFSLAESAGSIFGGSAQSAICGWRSPQYLLLLFLHFKLAQLRHPHLIVNFAPNIHWSHVGYLQLANLYFREQYRFCV